MRRPNFTKLGQDIEPSSLLAKFVPDLPYCSICKRGRIKGECSNIEAKFRTLTPSPTPHPLQKLPDGRASCLGKNKAPPTTEPLMGRLYGAAESQAKVKKRHKENSLTILKAFRLTSYDLVIIIRIICHNYARTIAYRRWWQLWSASDLYIG